MDYVRCFIHILPQFYIMHVQTGFCVFRLFQRYNILKYEHFYFHS